VLALAGLTCGLVEPCAAQTVPGFAIGKYQPAASGSDWFASESLDLRGSARPAAGVVLDLGYEPLVSYDADGSEGAAVIAAQVLAHLGGGIVLADKFRFGLSIPVLLANDGERVRAVQGEYEAGAGPALGDLRVSADVLLVGMYGRPLSLALGAHLFVPTGSQSAYTSDGTVRALPRLMAAGEIGDFVYAAHAGVHIRPHSRDFTDTKLGHELVVGAAAGIRLLDRALTVGPEIYGASIGPRFSKEGSVPIEALVGGKYTVLQDYRVGLAAGPGLTEGLGAAELRAVASVEWSPAIPDDRDRDRDGVIDLHDECPTVPTGAKPDPFRLGCPAEDADGDGIVDHEDACPEAPGVHSLELGKNGCPPPAPSRKKPSDRDKDGVTDDLDKCPDEPGVPEADGCPRAMVDTKAQQIRIMQRIEFAYAKASLLPDSTPVLEAVAAILREHREISHVVIQGHTDNVGGSDYNVKLSQRRAETVRRWLLDRGIAAERLQAVGFGEERPLESNDTEQGRRTNRRVEFHIKGGSAEDSAHRP
jgi:outer membrane protein OmpA-like peptidoglycan-associated protein